jgi:hypothetical protein
MPERREVYDTERERQKRLQILPLSGKLFTTAIHISNRFKACLRAGMSVNAVLAKPQSLSYDENGNGSLVFLLKCRRAMFVMRSKHLVNIYGGAEVSITLQI